MKIENMSGKIYSIDMTGEGIEPLSAGTIQTNPPRYFIGKFDDLHSRNKKTRLHLILLTDNKYQYELVQCWIHEAIYKNADAISVRDGTYTIGTNIISLPLSMEESDFTLQLVKNSSPKNS